MPGPLASIPWLVVVVGAAMMVSLFLIALGTMLPHRQPGLPLTNQQGAPLLPARDPSSEQLPLPVASDGPMTDSPAPLPGGRGATSRRAEPPPTTQPTRSDPGGNAPGAGQHGLPPAGGNANGPSRDGPSNVMLMGGQSRRCLDIDNFGTANGTQAQLWDCNGGYNQRWTYTAAQQIVLYGNKCLTAGNRGTTDGTPAVIWDCDGGSHQRWTIRFDGTVVGERSGLCLDAYFARTGNGTQIVLWSCNGGANQRWRLLN
ncbi:RICIN domain-containing protein [Micromonospora zhanjiangensis]